MEAKRPRRANASGSFTADIDAKSFVADTFFVELGPGWLLHCTGVENAALPVISRDLYFIFHIDPDDQDPPKINVLVYVSRTASGIERAEGKAGDFVLDFDRPNKHYKSTFSATLTSLQTGKDIVIKGQFDLKVDAAIRQSTNSLQLS